MSSPDQISLPVVFEPPNPGPRPDKQKVIQVQKKPVIREAVHPENVRKQA